MKAIILAGGKGTRMGNISNIIPKPMIDIGGKPVLHHQIEQLIKYDFEEVILIVNHLKDQIIDYFGHGEKFGINIEYFEEPEPLGTVGGLTYLKDYLNSDFLVLYGDIMFDMDLYRLMDFHFEKRSDCTLVLHPNDHPFDSDLVDMDSDSKITGFFAKPHDETIYYRNLVNAAIYILSPKIFRYLKKGVKADFGRDIFPAIYNNINMYGYLTTEYIKDIGTTGRLKEVTKDYNCGRISIKNIRNKQKCIFLDRDGVLNIHKDYIYSEEMLEIYPYAAEAVAKINKSDYLAVVTTNQPVVARNLCTIDELEYIHKKLEYELGKKGAYLDRIYYCPHHPDKGYPDENPIFKIDCPCRKPKPGMLFKAAEEMNIDLEKSYMIGDSFRDIEAGKAAGVSTVGLLTGVGLKDLKTEPDFIFDNLKDAVDFIIDNPYEAHSQSIYKTVRQVEKPFIVSIGGNARSGKSVFSAYLKKVIQNNGLKVVLIKLDSWIIPENKRDNAKNVYDRFNMKKLEKDIKEILSGKTVTITAINRITKKEEIKQYNVENADVIIIEGVPALATEYLRSAANIKIFINVDEKLRKQRFFNYYRSSGKTNEEIEKIYNERLEDEYKKIIEDADYADILINTQC